MNNSRSSRRTGATLGSITARKSFERTVFADPCSPAMDRDRLRAVPLTAMPRPARSRFRKQDSKTARAPQLIRPVAGAKGLHAGAAAEPDRRVLGDLPTVGADFDAAPKLI